MNIQGLRLINERAPIGGQVDNGLLRNLPDGLVNRFEFGGNTGDCVTEGSATIEDGERRQKETHHSESIHYER